jgi:hypothetical protein
VLLDEAAHRRAASARRVAFGRRHGAVRVAVEALRRRGALGVEFLLRDRVVAVGVDLGEVRGEPRLRWRGVAAALPRALRSALAAALPAALRRRQAAACRRQAAACRRGASLPSPCRPAA